MSENTDKLEREIELGDNARRLLEDETLQLAFERLKENMRAAWETSEPENAEGREKFYYGLRAVIFVENELQKMLADGTYAAHKLERKK